MSTCALRAITVFSIVALASGAAAALDPPHDASNSIGCVDCHAMHGGGMMGWGVVPGGAEQAAMCKSCHNPTGQAASMSDVAVHTVGTNTVIDCGSCHDAHGPQEVTDPHTGEVGPNLKLLRANMTKYVAQAIEPAVFQKKPEHFAFDQDNPPWSGACQACHKSTTHHTNDGAADHDHMQGAGCTSCHAHKAGFAPEGGCFACHDQPQNGRRQIVGTEGDFSKANHHVSGTIEESDCAVCHYMNSHGSGTVRLKSPDLSGVVIDYDPDEPATLGPFCAGCHDGDGAAAGGGLTPFSDGVTVPDIGGTAGETWAASAHATLPHPANDNTPISCVGDGEKSGCHNNAHGSDGTAMLAAEAGATIDTFCVGCHTGDGHVSTDTFTIGAKTFDLRCTTCHNPHIVTGKLENAGAGKSPITWPALTADPATNPRAMGATLWGDAAGEKMSDQAGSGTYKTPTGDTLTGEELPDYVSFCLSCHGPMDGPHGGVKSTDHHGSGSANVPNGGGACPNWYGCGKGRGWNGDSCEATEDECWPVLSRGKGEQIWTRLPYNQEERIAGANFVLACHDCHQTHGPGIGQKLRTEVNGGPGTVVWNTMCNNCHYYYSDWHAGMSCGTASCHTSNSPHRMTSGSGSGATRIFDPDLVADLRMESNLKDSGTWRLHSRWFDTAGSFAAGKSGKAVVLNGDQPIEVGTTNAYWSTDEGKHGTWKYSELKYNGSLEAWVYPTQKGASEYLIAAKHTYNDGGYAFLLRSVGSLRAALLVNVNGGGVPGVWDEDCNGLRGAYSSVAIPLDRWTHVAATFDTSLPDRDPADLSVGRIRIYVNGEDVTTSNASLPFECYSQPGAGEDIIYAYSLHSPDNESICYAGHWCASALSVGGVMWGAGSRKGLVGRLDDFKLWNVTRPADYFDAKVGPTLAAVVGTDGSDQLTVTFNEGVYGQTGSVGSLTPASLALVDAGGDNPRSILSVDHVAGTGTAVVTMSAPLIAADIGADTLVAAAGAVFDDQDTACDTTPLTIEAQAAGGPVCPPTGEPTLFELNEASGSTTATDTLGIMDGDVYGDSAFVGDGTFHGDGVNNYVIFENPTCLNATTMLTLKTRIKPSVVDDGNATTFSRIFARTGTGGYQLSVWRNESWATFNPPDDVASLALWVRVVDPHGGNAWKPTLTHYDTCPIVADHWYSITVTWDSDKVGGPPSDILIDDQGTDGADAGELWAGDANCTDSAQVLVAEAQKLWEGDQILPVEQSPVLGANSGNLKFKFQGLIDWLSVSIE